MRITGIRLVSALGAATALATLCAPAAVADPGNTVCEPGQIVIDGQCNTPPAPSKASAPNGNAPAAGTGDQSGEHH
jgi:hypothetical protein